MKSDMASLIYLASPFSHERESVREKRFHDACEATAKLLKLGYLTFSPIVHSFPLAKHGIDGDTDFWVEQIDKHYLRHCAAVFVLEIPGWKQSKGVTKELWIAHATNKPIRYTSVPRLDSALRTINHPIREPAILFEPEGHSDAQLV
jgi:hypothetical protein